MLSKSPVQPSIRGLKTRVDVHTHVVPPFWGEALASHGGDPSGWTLPKWSPDAALKFMDELNIATKVLSVTAPGVGGWPASEQPGLCRKINEYVQDLGVRYPGRFGNFASLPLPDAEASIKEAAYALDTLGADGVVVYTNYDGVYLGDKKFRPVWQALNDRKATVFIHPTHLELKVLAGQPAPLVDYPFDSTRNAVHMVLNGVVRDFPNLKIILSHAGGFLPFFALRVTELAGTLNPDGPSGDQLLKEFQSFYFDTALASGPYALPTVLKFAGRDHVLFGSDFPYAPPEVGASFTHKLDSGSDVSQADIDAINNNGRILFPRFA